MIPIRALLAPLLLVAATLPAGADWVPMHPLHIVVPYVAGGQPDLVARALAEPLSRALGQPVVIENRPGAGGNVASEGVAHSAPDGYTLLMGTNGPLSVSPVLYNDLHYDPFTDLAPVTLIGTSPNLIAVNLQLGVSTLGELVAKARANPGRLNFSSVGKGSVSQLSMELLNHLADISTVHIPYNGGAPAVTALLTGDVQILSLNSTMLMPQVEAGKVRVLAQTTAKRSPLFPQIPTVTELGYPGFEAGIWMVIMVSAKTSPEVIRRLNTELVKIIRDPALKRTLWDRQWIDPVGSTPAEAAALIRAESARWAAVVRAAGLTGE
jgi:tripartite-type tricarboxylate transporter receptor subunit TctC